MPTPAPITSSQATENPTSKAGQATENPTSKAESAKVHCFSLRAELGETEIACVSDLVVATVDKAYRSNDNATMLLLPLLPLILASTAPLHLYAQDLAIPYPPPSSHIIHSLPHHYITEDELPQTFTWQNVNGNSYLTRMRNQHIP
eukprot:scaffold34142_cov80-Skeletonema_marinoi.AAC.1